MVDPAFVMHKHIHVEANYNPAGIDFLTKKAIPLTENTKLVIAVFQEEGESHPPDTAIDSWNIIPLTKVKYSVHAWEVVEDDFQQFKGVKNITFQSHVNAHSRHLMAQVLLKDTLKEEHHRYTHYEIEINVVIFEPLAHICSSEIEFA